MKNLRAYLTEVAASPFRYGRHDCCTVAAIWVQAQTGKDVLRGNSYKSLKDGMRQLEAHGFKTHVDAYGATLERVNALSLVAGDVAVLPGADGMPALGIVLPGGEAIWCFGPGGAGTVPLTTAQYGFRTA